MECRQITSKFIIDEINVYCVLQVPRSKKAAAKMRKSNKAQHSFVFVVATHIRFWVTIYVCIK